jgi:predicted ArsR family transcriptional regulator
VAKPSEAALIAASSWGAASPESRWYPAAFMNGVRASGASAGGHVTREQIVVALRRAGPVSPDALARSLAISRTSALQQLRALADQGLVSRSVVRHGVGRPRHVYELTSQAQTLFPQSYQALAGDLLGAIEQLGGHDMVEQAFELRRRRLREAILRRFEERGLLDAPLEVRARELARFQDEQGYLCECRREARDPAVAGYGADGAPNGSNGATNAHRADAREPLDISVDGVIRLREHNCAIYEVARRDDTPCREEARLFSEVLGVAVVRESHIASGDRCCSYRIEEPTARA